MIDRNLPYRFLRGQPLKLFYKLYFHAFAPGFEVSDLVSEILDGLKIPNSALYLSLGTVCYEYPSRNSSVPMTVNCAFPENLCFKYDNTTASGKQVTIQGCISADECQQLKDQHLHCCEGYLCNSSKYNGHNKAKKLPVKARSAVFRGTQRQFGKYLFGRRFKI